MITAREIIFSARFIGLVRYERARQGDVSGETGGPGQGDASREDGRAGMNERAAGMRRVRRARRVRGAGRGGSRFFQEFCLLVVERRGDGGGQRWAGRQVRIGVYQRGGLLA